jgi:predicted HD phosphohydrolase
MQEAMLQFATVNERIIGRNDQLFHTGLLHDVAL